MKKVVLSLLIMVTCLFSFYGQEQEETVLQTFESSCCRMSYTIIQENNGKLYVFVGDGNMKDFLIVLVNGIDDAFDFIYETEAFFQNTMFDDILASYNTSESPVKTVINKLQQEKSGSRLSWKRFSDTGEAYLEYNLR